MSSGRVFALPKSSADKTKEVDPRDAAIFADEQARARVIRWMVAIYCFGAIIGIVCILIGVIAPAWYTSSVSVEQSPTSQGTITFSEEWRMATTGISVLTKFCSTKGGCLVDRDLFIFFDRTSNEVSNHAMYVCHHPTIFCRALTGQTVSHQLLRMRTVVGRHRYFW